MRAWVHMIVPEFSRGRTRSAHGRHSSECVGILEENVLRAIPLELCLRAVPVPYFSLTVALSFVRGPWEILSPGTGTAFAGEDRS